MKLIRLIDHLRKTYPGKWTYDGHGRDNGDQVWRCSAPAPRYDGDDDNFVTQIWYYPVKGTPEIVRW